MRAPVHTGQSTRAIGAWKALALLTATNLLMSVDRTLPQLVSEQVKSEFALSDAQLGIFIGIAFGATYGLAGLAIGPVIDRSDRKTFLTVILSIWSGMTFITGFATSYIWLLVSRAGVGAAEAGGNPAAVSIIGDLFPAEKRSSAIGIYKIGVPLGIFLASVLVSALVARHGWRSVFFVAGVPGLVLAGLMWLNVQDPPRGNQDGVREQGYRAASYGAALRFVFGDGRVLPLTMGLFLAVFAGAAIQAFLASFLQRSHGIRLQDVGFLLAIGSGMSAISPVIVGMAADRVARRGNASQLYFIAALNGLTTLAALLLLALNGLPGIASLLVWQILSMGLMAPAMAALLSLSPVGMRGTVIALVSVGNMFLGFGLGPVSIGYVSDYIRGGDSLRISMLLVSVSAYVASTLAFYFSARNSAKMKRAF